MLFALVILLTQPGYPAESTSNDDSQPVQKDSSSYYLIEQLKIAIAWGLVPLGAEVMLNSGSSWLVHNQYYFFKGLLDIHSSNIRRATSLHLTDNLSGKLETGSYKIISDEAKKKKTIDLQQDLISRSLSTFSILSLHAQKSRKTWFRLQGITDTLASSASLALSRGDQSRAAALIAFVGQLVVYIHPEYHALDVATSIDSYFSRYVDWSKYSGFRSEIVKHLTKMDPLYRQYSTIRLRYCDLFTHWLRDSGSCEQLESAALAEIGTIADEIAANGSSSKIPLQQGGNKLFSGISADQIRTSIFILGVTVPGTMMYFLGKQNPAIDAVARHLTKVVGFATTKTEMERFSSQSRRKLENWGAVDTGRSVNRSSGLVEYANLYFSTLQKNAGKILAEQPNFARSNSQRALEMLAIHFSDAYKQPVGDDSSRATILASALIHTRKEMVELKTKDTLVRSLILAYQPFEKSSVIPYTRKALSASPDSGGDTNNGYGALIDQWAHLSETPAFRDSPTLTGMFTQSADSCSGDGCPASQAVPEEPLTNDLKTDLTIEKATKPNSWYDYLPGFDVVKIQGAALGYSILMAMIKPYTIDKFKPQTKTPNSFRQLGTYYFLASMIDFGLRSLGEPAIVHLQTVIKNLIGSATGILSPEDVQIQDELAAKVTDINRKLSIEAQTSRSYKMPCESLLLRGWSLATRAAHQPANSPDESAAVLAYTAYIYRYFHPEFEADDKIIAALAHSRLIELHEMLARQNLMSTYLSQVYIHLTQLDPGFSNPVIKKLYQSTLNNWGFDSDDSSAQYAEDVLDSWAVYGDWLLGASGFLTQAMIKAAVHTQGLFVRSLAYFGANILEYGTTDPLRKKIYAFSRLKLLNLFSSYEPSEQMAADYANKKLTASFRRQKFHFGKLELDMRTQLVQIITSVINGFSEARFYLAANEDDKAVNLIALSLKRIILYAPDISGDDEYLSAAIRTLVRPFQPRLAELNGKIIEETRSLLKQEQEMTHEIYGEAMGKARTISMLWLKK